MKRFAKFLYDRFFKLDKKLRHGVIVFVLSFSWTAGCVWAMAFIGMYYPISWIVPPFMVTVGALVVGGVIGMICGAGIIIGYLERRA